MISTIGVFAGAVSPYMVAYIRGLTGEFIYSLYFMAGGLLLAAILLITFVTPKMLAGDSKTGLTRSAAGARAAPLPIASRRNHWSCR